MIDDSEEERLARRNAWLRSTFAAVVVAGAHVGGFAWLSTHSLSTPPDSVLGVPLELDLLAVAPPEPPHDVAPPAPAAPPPPQKTPDATPDATPTPAAAPSPEPAPPTQEPTPTQEPSPPPSPEPPTVEPVPTPSPQPTQEAAPPSPEPSPEPPTPTPTQATPPDAVLAPSPPPPPPKPRAEPPKPRPSPPPKPRPSPPPPPKPDPDKVERERAQAEEKERARAEAKDRAREARRQAKIDANRASNDTTRSDSEGRPGASQRPVSSGANLATWRGEVLARISEFKPSSNGASGTAVVAFTVDSGGRVVSATLVRSSGDSSLDAACVAMVRRASPVPAPPPELGGRVNLTVPVRFQ